MASEENTNSSGGGGRLSKKLKNKKIPQRGMGVAQLERIISEEQHKNDVAILTPNSTNFRPPPLIPLAPPLPPNHRPLIIKTDTNPIFVSKPMHTSSDGGYNWNRLSSGGDPQFEGENPNQSHGSNHRAYTGGLPTNLSGLRYESNLSPTTAQRSQLFQQPCSSSMGNASLRTSSSSSVMYFQMEPPSNQSYRSNNYPPSPPRDKKTVGMKRSYPFSMENMQIPSINFKFPASPTSRSIESTSGSNGGTNPLSREKNTSNLVTKDFLTLAPPQPSPSKDKLSPLLATHQGQTKESSGSELSNGRPLYSFLPTAKNPGNNNGEEGELVDLNLKL